ncbi:hypothetical protein GCM10008967_10340 [Bacillus carboniphilus]|uniref:Uncharacterized protein n=2 Tax=Bacillati TaxID=1783272 RepID=A0ABN0W0B2_9BACI
MVNDALSNGCSADEPDRRSVILMKMLGFRGGTGPWFRYLTDLRVNSAEICLIKDPLSAKFISK